MAFFAFFCEFLGNYELSAVNREITKENNKKGGGLTAGPHKSGSQARPPPLLRARTRGARPGSPRRRSPPAGLTGGGAAGLQARPRAAGGCGVAAARGEAQGQGRRRLAAAPGHGGGGAWCSGGCEARRRRERPARAPWSPGGPRARGGGAQGGAEGAGGVCGRRPACSRRRGGASTAAAAD